MGQYLISKYKNVYRLLCDVDQSTKDFPREKNGNYSYNDVYIACKKNIRIFHYGKNILQVYIPSIGVFKNIIKQIIIDTYNKEYLDNYIEKINTKHKNEDVIVNKYQFDDLYKTISDDNNIPIFDIHEYDKEAEFKIKNENLNFIFKYITPKTSGASYSPFSNKNLPKSNYKIDDNDLQLYKNVTQNLSLSDGLLVKEINIRYNKYFNRKYKIDINKNRKFKYMKFKEYIHSLGKEYWIDYINYLTKQLKKQNKL